MAWILVDFDLSLFTRIPYVKPRINILIVKILGVPPRKHQYYSVFETICPWSLQSDKYHEYWLIDLYLSLLLNVRLKLIYCENSRCFEK